METIQVQPERLIQSASQIDEANQLYHQYIAQLYQVVDELSLLWKGKDNQAFVAQIGKFHTDFKQLAAICDQYSQFLRQTAMSYQATQDDLTSRIQGL